MPESMDKIEFRDGEVIVAPAPSLWHQETLRRILWRLSAWAADYPGEVCIGQSPLDIRFAPGRILQPDACIFLAKLPLDHVGPIERIPEVCIEVVSGNRVYDRVTKRLIYAHAGVREYWVIDPAGHVERWSGDDLEHQEEARDRLTCALLPGFELDVPGLFVA